MRRSWWRVSDQAMELVEDAEAGEFIAWFASHGDRVCRQIRFWDCNVHVYGVCQSVLHDGEGTSLLTVEEVMPSPICC